MNEAERSQKRTKFGSVKYVYKRDVMVTLRTAFERMIAEQLPAARILYWT